MQFGCYTEQAANLFLDTTGLPVQFAHSGPETEHRQRINPKVTEGTGVQILTDYKKRMVAAHRRAPRYRFIADAEVKEILADTNLKAQSREMSIGGCFLDMPNPSPKETKIRVRVSHGGSTFTALDRVAFVVPSMGMSVAFTNANGDQVAVLQEWLSDSSRTAQSNDYGPAQ
jgi:hypothetical protein